MISRSPLGRAAADANDHAILVGEARIVRNASRATKPPRAALYSTRRNDGSNAKLHSHIPEFYEIAITNEAEAKFRQLANGTNAC